jgi:hypothetical protein
MHAHRPQRLLGPREQRHGHAVLLCCLVVASVTAAGHRHAVGVDDERLLVLVISDKPSACSILCF